VSKFPLRMSSNNCASCEHAVAEHHMSWGRCEQQCIDPDMGDIYCCPCPHFERDTDA
jgi:hypothetical protein